MRFIGSKALLLSEIDEVISENIKDAKSFCDIFSGTATVARHFKEKYEIISNDLLHFSYVLQQASIKNEGYPKFEKLTSHLNSDPFDYFDSIDLDDIKVTSAMFIHNNYTPNAHCERMYLSNDNGKFIDFIRQKIEEWYSDKFIDENEYYYLLAGLIEAVPFVSNIAGTYGAYLKHWDKRSQNRLKLIKLRPATNNKDNQCFNLDANQLITKVSGDILYIDPPYNNRQYAPNYHLLETISRYDNPEIYGKTGMRPYKDIKSDYCLKGKVLSSFEHLISNAKFEHIIISYSTEGILELSEIEKILKSHAENDSYKLKKIPYRRYKHRAGDIKHDLHELIFYIRKSIL